MRRSRAFVIAAATLGLVAAGLSTPAFAAQTPTVTVGGFAAATDPTPDIVGGHEPSRPWPGMASLQVDRGPDDPQHHTCGAVLVFRQWVATEAHCVTTYPSPQPRPANLYHVRIGSADRTTGGILAGVSQILVHQNWAWQDGPGIVGDLAMLKLDTYVNLQQFEIATHLQNTKKVTLLGWGATEPNPDEPSPLPTGLQELDTKLLPHTRCAGDAIGIDELCVANPHGTSGPCRGDSGGPALQQVPGTGTRQEPARWWVIGGTIGGPHFCGTTPSIYENWAYWYQWFWTVARTGTVPPAISSGPPAGATRVPGRRWAAWHQQCQQLGACQQ